MFVIGNFCLWQYVLIGKSRLCKYSIKYRTGKIIRKQYEVESPIQPRIV